MKWNFDWDVHNINHIGKHGFTPQEVEFVLHHALEFCHLSNDYTEFRRCVIGVHPNGKFVKVIYNERHGKHRVVTAFFTSQKPKKNVF